MYYSSNMLTGVEYAHSEEKRKFDLQAIKFAIPFAKATQFALSMSQDGPTDFLQTRIGQNGDEIQVHKLRTLKEDGLTPVNRTAAFMRRSGLDELIQYRNIQEGSMSMVARRPLMPNEYEEAFDGVELGIIDNYMKIVVPTKPGLVSSFVIASHLGQIEDHALRQERLEMDIQDVIDGSLARDKHLFRSASINGLTNKMRRGDIRPIKAS
jgi:lipopolysaccharide/colanic/teichoic acid biosynthesis glycosyltransferase